MKLIIAMNFYLQRIIPAEPKFCFWQNRSSKQGEMVVIIFDVAFEGTEEI